MVADIVLASSISLFAGAKAISRLNLNHVVITSVDRDDLKDGGAEHFSKVINETKKLNSNTTIEVLTPDFWGGFTDKINANELQKQRLEKVLSAKPVCFNHNLETVPRLYRKVRPGSRYFASVNLLKSAKEIYKNIFNKSVIILGIG